MQSNNPQQYPRKKLSGLFLKTFTVTILAVAVVIAAGWLTLRSVSKPPVIDVSGKDIAGGNAAEKDAHPTFLTPEQSTEGSPVGEGEEHTSNMATPAERKPLFYTFLLFGEDGGINTDTIMVGAYDGTAKKAYIISVPRDTKVNVNRTVKKINGAYPTGTVSGGHEGGVNQLRRELHTLIGFIPDFYVCVNFDAFRKVVDAVGGVDINVPYLMDYRDSAQDLRIYFTEGLHTLNGQEALEFARHRKNNDANEHTTVTYTDYQRIENQQQVIKAVMEKVLQPANLLKTPEFIEIFNENVQTDLKASEITWFAEEFLQIKDNPGLLETYTLPISGSSYPNGSYEFPDQNAVLELVNRTVNPYLEAITESDVDYAPH